MPPKIPPRISPKQKEEQMENSSPNPSFSICDIQIQKQMSRSFGKSFPQKIVLPKLRPHCSATCPNTWRAEPRKKNTLSFFKRNSTPRQNRNARSVFSFGVAGVLASAWGFLRAYDSIQSHHALRACHIICFGSRCEFGTIETQNL